MSFFINKSAESQQQQRCSWSGMMPFCPVSRIVDTKWKCVGAWRGFTHLTATPSVSPDLFLLPLGKFSCTFICECVKKKRLCFKKKNNLKWFLFRFLLSVSENVKNVFILRQIFRFCSPSDIIFRFLASWFWILEVFLALFGPCHSDIAGSQSVHDVRSRRVGCPSTVMF